jgi:hypothetical protein
LGFSFHCFRTEQNRTEQLTKLGTSYWEAAAVRFFKMLSIVF